MNVYAALGLVSQVRTSQITRASRSVLTAAGGSFPSFLASLGGPDATDGTWEAVYVEAFAPSTGILATALSTYLQSLGLTSGQAATQLATIWTAAVALSP